MVPIDGGESFKTDNPLERWSPDYVYFTSKFSLLEFEPLADIGTDHFPLLADLRYAGVE